MVGFNYSTTSTKASAIRCRAARDSRSVVRAFISMRLPRRALGSTGLEVSVIGFGASPLGGVFQVIAIHMPLQRPGQRVKQVYFGAVHHD